MNVIARYPSNAKHSYEIEIAVNQSIVVDADTRSQASKIAKQLGYTVRSVNMVG